MKLKNSDVLDLVQDCLDAHMQKCDNAAAPPNPIVPHLTHGGEGARIESMFIRGGVLLVDLDNGESFSLTVSKCRRRSESAHIQRRAESWRKLCRRSVGSEEAFIDPAESSAEVGA